MIHNAYSPQYMRLSPLERDIHLIAVRSSDDGLRWAIGETHQRYTRRINFREKWRGYLWQGRFASFVMDEPYLLAAARYIELNPIRARLVQVAGDWPWRSARAHLGAQDDRLVKVAAILAMVPDWNAFLEQRRAGRGDGGVARHVPTARPLGDETFLGRLEEMAGRALKPQKRGPKPKHRAN